MKENRNFKGIWIPAEVWLSKKINLMEKLFLVEIDSLDNEKGCFASNKYFAEFFGISNGRCSQIINSLAEKNIIKIKLNRKGKQVVNRKITLFNKLNRGYLENDNKPIKNIKGGYLENDKENNTKAIIHKSNNKEKEKKESFDFFWEIYLKKTDRKKSMRIWLRDNLHDKRDEIINNLVRQNQHDYKYREKKHIPNPTTYLNGERWNDEIIEVNQNATHSKNTKLTQFEKHELSLAKLAKQRNEIYANT